ncbi:hypothetical protein PV10_01560 [Exophiala mesophila]|uniref:EKC/KEOPS complex subunit BUD32 n=1 Tax=Exophiala mesophila TaxID=212818 RepID=A0A0D1YB44_EXOME|nr:uncharacterized protein PV10_01560 [Exophiala mesophila]KIV97856.1 hypothetical protein PV10_01560 [Exophiala mesophila]
MEPLHYVSSTSQFSRIGPGLVVKAPMEVSKENPNHKQLEEHNAKAIDVEAQILKRLGRHPRIVPFHGVNDTGILLSEAVHGNLQAYIDSNNPTIDTALRWKWSLQAAEAIAYLHEKGVIHSDLRPENYLVHATVEPRDDVDPSPSLDLWLCDFGGSVCEELGLDGGHLPDDPFFDHRKPWVSTRETDIFSLGSVFFNILTGYWPYREGPPPKSMEGIIAYEKEVNELFTASKFPDVSKSSGGNVIKGCWDYRYQTAQDVVEAIKREIAVLGM